MGNEYGGDRYRLITSECTDNLTTFTRNIWANKCVSCEDDDYMKKASGAIAAHRTIVHLSSFPVITDIVFSYLAWRNDKKYGKPVACSELSVQSKKKGEVLSLRAGFY